MTKTKFKPSTLDAFASQINIDLYNNIIAFVREISTAKNDTMQGTAVIKILHRKVLTSNIGTDYGIKYFGELLDRYEEKIGSDIKTVRAVALALASSLVSDDMFHHRQKVKFLLTLKYEHKDDFYIQCALFLIARNDNEDSTDYYDSILNKEYSATEEILFALSILPNLEETFKVLKPQVISLLGVNRTISVFGNAQLFEWLVGQLSAILKIYRTRDMASLRALHKLFNTNVKKGDRPHDILLENGYNADDIAYLNYMFVFLGNIYGSIQRYSIVGQKILIECFSTILSSESEYDSNVYDFLVHVYSYHQKLKPVCYGHSTLSEAIRDRIKLLNASSWMCLFEISKESLSALHIYCRDIFNYDFMDGKWDVISKKIPYESYLEVLNLHLCSIKSTEDILKTIKKFEALTEKTYGISFDERNGISQDVFNHLVNQDVFDLIGLHSTHIANAQSSTMDGDNTKNVYVKYITSYIKRISSRKEFDFIAYLYSQYDIKTIKELYGSDFDISEGLYRCVGTNNRYHSIKQYRCTLTLQRDFLSVDEHLQLYNWLDDFIYIYELDEYISFVVGVLSDDFLKTIISQEELSNLFTMIMAKDSELLGADLPKLKENFWTKEVLEAENKAKEELEDERQKQAKLQEQKETEDAINIAVDKSLESLLGFFERGSISYNEEKRVYAFGILIPKLNFLLDKPLNKSDVYLFLKLVGRMYADSVLVLENMTEYISKIKEVA